jgi:carbonic anhydrase/acetyltransferase-like protein (isoleucine patch superfamily)
VIKTGEIWAGAPAKLLRTLSAEEAAFIGQSAATYVALAAEHK